MAKKPLYYTGAGVLRFDDEDYAYGAELPAGLPEETVKSLLEKRKASHTAPSLATPAVVGAAASAELAEALSTIEAMRTAAEEGTAYITKLEGELAAAQETIAQHVATIEQLTAQLTTAPAAAPAEGGAGPRK